MNTRYKVLGINDDRDICDACGKTGLKRVVWFEDTETGSISAVGTTCASYKLYGHKKKSGTKSVMDTAWLLTQIREKLDEGMTVREVQQALGPQGWIGYLKEVEGDTMTVVIGCVPYEFPRNVKGEESCV